jgi:hypothetical protein
LLTHAFLLIRFGVQWLSACAVLVVLFGTGKHLRATHLCVNVTGSLGV